MKYNYLYNLSLDHIRIFLTVARYENFTYAAHELFMTQASVSKIIAQIEQCLNCKVFTRSRYGVKLTENGKELLDEWGAAFDAIITAGNRIKYQADTAEQKIKVGCYTSLDDTLFLMDIVDRFEKKHKDSYLEIIKMLPQQVFDQLISGRLDVAFLSEPYRRVVKRSYVKLKIYDAFPIEPCLVISKGNPFFTEPNVDLKELAKQPLVAMCEPFVERWSYVEQVYQECGFEIPEVFFVNNPHTMALDLMRKPCVALMDEGYTPIARDNFRYFSLPKSTLKSGFFLAVNEKKQQTVINDFIETVKIVSKEHSDIQNKNA